jgi:hypothetical protein
MDKMSTNKGALFIKIVKCSDNDRRLKHKMASYRKFSKKEKSWHLLEPKLLLLVNPIKFIETRYTSSYY